MEKLKLQLLYTKPKLKGSLKVLELYLLENSDL